MNKLQNSIEPEDFRRLAELHDMASHACELLKAMSNKWRLMILCQLSEGEKTVKRNLMIFVTANQVDATGYKKNTE